MTVAVFGFRYNHTLVAKEMFAGSLLFAMGMQNALVSIVSGSVVRTTHLTGTFTDLGIELAQYIQKKHRDDQTLRSRIKLRTMLVFSFMFGALGGAYLFHYLSFRAFWVPVAILWYALLYDVFRIAVTRYYRQLINNKNRSK
jgi:uncharacterized membrane protein YoaK (UPF0700 family)